MAARVRNQRDVLEVETDTRNRDNSSEVLEAREESLIIREYIVRGKRRVTDCLYRAPATLKMPEIDFDVRKWPEVEVSPSANTQEVGRRGRD